MIDSILFAEELRHLHSLVVSLKTVSGHRDPEHLLHAIAVVRFRRADAFNLRMQTLKGSTLGKNRQTSHYVRMSEYSDIMATIKTLEKSTRVIKLQFLLFPFPEERPGLNCVQIWFCKESHNIRHESYVH